MQRSIQQLSFAIAIAILQLNASADEVWNYKFIVNGSRPYRGDCDCATPMYADVAGSFSILLDWPHGTGKLLQLNDHLTNVAYGSYSPTGGLVITPANLPELDYGIMPSYSQSTFNGGHFTYTNGVGRLQSTPGFGHSYDITFGQNTASLSLNLFIIDGGVTVTNAAAIFAGGSVAGDYNKDARVDARDYIALRNSGGSQFDYSLWRTYFGTGIPATAADAAPEPSAVILVVGATAALLAVRSRKFSR